MKKVLILSLLGLFLVLMLSSLASAVCTVNIDSSYNLGETATATMACDEASEKNTPYTLNWTNASGVNVELDTGTTPNSVSENFFDTYVIPANFTTAYGTILNVTLQGTGLEGTDSATISAVATNELIISNIEISDQFLIGRVGGIHFLVNDSNNKAVENAQCSIEVLDDGQKPVIVSEIPVRTINGEAGFSTSEIISNFFNEGRQYSFRLHCSCGINETINQNTCWNEDGDNIPPAQASTLFPFSIGTWLSSNTLTNKDSYIAREEIFICANVTNLEFSKRVPMEIYHQVRCSGNSDNNDDLDRNLLTSDGTNPDERGISVNTTQNQCKRFIMPEPKYLQGRTSTCYASTSVWVLNERREKIMNYVTTSPSFNFTIADINIDADWQHEGENVFNTIINLSDSKYSSFNGTLLMGNIDIRLEKDYSESLRAEDQYIIYPQNLKHFLMVREIKNVTAYNASGDEITAIIEVLDDGNVEIEIRDTDITPNGWVNVTMEVESFEERSTIAEESIQSNIAGIKSNTDAPIVAGGGGQGSGYIPSAQQTAKEATISSQIGGFFNKIYDTFEGYGIAPSIVNGILVAIIVLLLAWVIAYRGTKDEIVY